MDVPEAEAGLSVPSQILVGYVTMGRGGGEAERNREGPAGRPNTCERASRTDAPSGWQEFESRQTGGETEENGAWLVVGLPGVQYIHTYTCSA